MSISNSTIINVKQLRESKNLSRRKVAVAIDVADSTVHRWESGEVQPHLPLNKIEILLDLFECDFKTLCAAFRQTALECQSAVQKEEVLIVA